MNVWNGQAWYIRRPRRPWYWHLHRLGIYLHAGEN